VIETSYFHRTYAEDPWSQQHCYLELLGRKFFNVHTFSAIVIKKTEYCDAYRCSKKNQSKQVANTSSLLNWNKRKWKAKTVQRTTKC